MFTVKNHLFENEQKAFGSLRSRQFKGEIELNEARQNIFRYDQLN